MSKNAKAILVAGVVILLAALTLLADTMLNRVTLAPAGTVGNTAGNLNNGGLFCEYNGLVYFSNPADEGALYSMTADEQNRQLLVGVKPRNILAGGQYLYYAQQDVVGPISLGNIRSGHDFYRCNLNGKKITTITEDVVVTGQLVDNHLYLLTAGNETPIFKKIKIDKSDETVLAKYQVNPACANNGTIYYNGTQNNHYLYALHTENDTVEELWAGNIWFPTYYNGDFYYLDVANNYRLCRYIVSENIVEVLTNDRVDCFNIGSGYIYYQCNSKNAPALKMMSIDGKDATVLAEGIYTQIHLTSRYVYFRAYENESMFYHAPIGSTIYSSM